MGSFGAKKGGEELPVSVCSLWDTLKVVSLAGAVNLGGLGRN